MFQLYNLLSAITLVVYLPWLIFKKLPDRRWRFIRERLGISSYEKTHIWIHAVSVGETIAVIPLLRRIRKEYPGKSITFSTTTYTGQKIAAERCTAADRVMYMPWDTSLCAGRVVKRLKPDIFITIETELWPILYHRLRYNGASILILNGRLSKKSFHKYRLIRFFMKKVLSYVDVCSMQSDEDASRIIALGADEIRVGVMGNLKFDMDFSDTASPSWLNGLNGHILLAGSTHRGEEEIIIEAYEKIRKAQHKKEMAPLKLIIAPRHPERFEEVEAMLRERGLHHIRRTEIGHVPMSGVGKTATERNARSSSSPLPDIIILDTIGELSQVFSVASVTFIGGSLLPYGGHNILEPAYWGNPVIFGPHMDNFPIASEFLTQKAAFQVRDANEIAARVIALCEDAVRGREVGQRAKEIVSKRAGATDKAMSYIRNIFGSS